MNSKIKVIGLGGMGANVLVSMKKNGIIADTLLIEKQCPVFIKQQVNTYEPASLLDSEKLGIADLMVIITGLAGNICTEYMIPIIQHAAKSCKDIILIGVMPFDFEALTDKANENYLSVKDLPIKRHILRNQELFEEKAFGDLSIKAAFNLVNDTIVELIKKEILS